MFNALTFSRQEQYRAEATSFRQGLFGWEQRLFDQHLPPPPSTILIGAAGGGRESLTLTHSGYHVVAFEPVRRLVESMIDSSRSEPHLEVLMGSYQALPILRSTDDQPVDLRQRSPFDAAILGWVSFSYLRSDADRIAALRKLGDLTNGPMLLSFFSVPTGAGAATFSINAGYVRSFSVEEIRKLAELAGLDVIATDDEYWGTAVLRRRQTGPALAT